MAPKKFTPRGRHRTLPIAGDTLSEICLGISTHATLVFRDTTGGESQLQLAEAISLHQHGKDFHLPGARPGSTFDPKQLHPLLELLGTTVVDAWAHHDGPLEIAFSNGSVLRVIPQGDYEAWHFQYPRPGRAIGGDLKGYTSLQGANGRLI